MSISMQFLFNTIRIFTSKSGFREVDDEPDMDEHLWIRWPLLDLMLLDILLKHSGVCVAVQVCPKIGAAIPVYGNLYENYDQP
jgi:hypothetical protein